MDAYDQDYVDGYDHVGVEAGFGRNEKRRPERDRRFRSSGEPAARRKAQILSWSMYAMTSA